MHPFFEIANWHYATPLLLRAGVLTIIHAQAAVEYSLRSSATTLSDPGSQFRVGECQLNTRFFSCLNAYYPGVTLFIIAMFPLLLWLMSRRRRIH